MNAEVSSRDTTGLSARTKAFAVRIVRLYSALPKTQVAQVIGKQLLRSGTSVGAHYREASRSRSPAEFISKLEVGVQELDETKYWIELLIECEIVPPSRLEELLSEADAIISMLVSSVKTAKEKSSSAKPK
jgi:four helix bundle protein